MLNKPGSSTTIPEARTLIRKLRDTISMYEPVLKFATLTLDWGPRQRGQGRRSGHMVKGSMSDAPRGKKTYTTVSLEDYINQNINNPDDFKYLDQPQRYAYVQARQFGCNHIEAMCFALIK